MRRLIVVLVTLAAAALFAGAAGLAYVVATGLSARPDPGRLEARLARRVRALAVPDSFRDRSNPVEASADVIERAMTHFAEHCAFCHANDGSGDAEIGRGLFPRPPDMRAAETQGLTDGELFYIIENGVRFTGMPAFATGDAEGETASWELVHFIRRLPVVSAEELARMESFNPRSPEEIRRDIEDELFLQGGPSTEDAPHAKGAHE